jgi:glutathione S-transferase
LLKLYGRAGSGSAAVEALLAETGTPFEFIAVPKPAPAAYLKINPRGEVPTLQMPSGEVMTESAAMMIYLADLHGLAPSASSPLRPRFLKWMVYMATTIYMSDLRMYYPERYSADAAHAPQVKARAIEHMARDFAILSEGLGEGPFLLGKEMSAADIYCAMLISWAEDVPALLARHPNLKRLHDLVAARPRIAAVWRRNGV